MRTAIYGGSFDVLTLGHTWVIEESLKLVDHLYIAVANHPTKKYLFGENERRNIIKEYLSDSNLQDRVTVNTLPSNCYLVGYPKRLKTKHSINFLIRGIRNATDYEYEASLKNINASINPNISTIFLMPPKHLSEVSSSTVKNLMGPQGWEDVVTGYVPPNVLSWLNAV